jgi:hypothetical protein
LHRRQNSLKIRLLPSLLDGAHIVPIASGAESFLAIVATSIHAGAAAANPRAKSKIMELRHDAELDATAIDKKIPTVL